MIHSNETQRKDAIAILKKEHAEVKALFDRFERSEESAERRNIAQEAVKKLKVHAVVEETLFYPALRQIMEDKNGIVEEADEEHHAAKVLIAELELMTGEEENYCAKFTVLAEGVRHHVIQEEGEMFPLARKTDIDLRALAEQMLSMKEALLRSGVPEDEEESMVRAAGVRGESPSKRAEKIVSVPMDGHGRRGRRNTRHERATHSRTQYAPTA